jgi:glycerophosphoryl diester phosphodiesterase
MTFRVSKASKAWLAITLIFAAVSAISLFTVDPGPDRYFAGLPAFALEGHQGARGLHPGDTLNGFRGALALGVTTLTMDLAMTSDGEIVVHDGLRLSPARTRGPDGAWLEPPGPALLALDLAALAAYDVGRLRPGSEAAARWPQQEGLDGAAIPTLGAAIALAEAVSGGRIRYNFDAGLTPLDPEISADPQVFAAALVAAIRAADIVERSTVQSFDWRLLAAVHRSAPEIRRVFPTSEAAGFDTVGRGKPGASPWTAGLDVDDYDASVPRLVAAAGGRLWAPRLQDLRDGDLAEARRSGLRVLVWTVNEPEIMADLLDRQVAGIVTDYPDRLRAVMAERGMALPPAYE